MNPEVLLYAERKTARLLYVVNELFVERLGFKASVTTDHEGFAAFSGAKINYSKQRINGSVHIIPAPLLFEKRLQDQDLEVRTVGGLPLLYADKVNALGHDPLAASFFLLSRYEEYLPYRHDQHGRFTSAASVLAKHDAVTIPLVERYADAVAALLQQAFGVIAKKPSYQLEVTVDVDQLFMYRAKGIARTFIGIMRDALTSQRSLRQRLDVMRGHQRDPLDIYDELIQQCSQRGVKPVFFFQVGDTTRFDINNPAYQPRVVGKINAIAVDAQVGLHPSYYSSEQPAMLEKEVDRLRNVTSNTVSRSRQHFLRFRMPATYRQLQELGIEHEYSMGFPDVNGFRASTCRPFRFFDLEREETTALVIHPHAFMDMVSVRLNPSLSACIEEVARLRQTVCDAGGVFSTIWHPETLVGHGVPFPSREILNSLLVP